MVLVGSSCTIGYRSRKVELMLSIKGTFEHGVARPVDHVEGRDGQVVIITFLDESVVAPHATSDDAAWTLLEQAIDEHAVATGIGDLAHQHDHYLHGKPKVG